MDYSVFVIATIIFLVAGFTYYAMVMAYCYAAVPYFRNKGWELLADYPSTVVYFLIGFPVLAILIMG